MAKKLLFATVLLALVGVQMLAARCNLRCGLAPLATGCHSAGASARCHSGSFGKSAGTGFSSNDSCDATPCRMEFKAAVKSGMTVDAPGADFAPAGASPKSAVGALVSPGDTLPPLLDRWNGPRRPISALRI